MKALRFLKGGFVMQRNGYRILWLICLALIFTLTWTPVTLADIGVEPGDVESQLNTGDVEMNEIVITNNGDAVDFTADIEITGEPERDERSRSLRGSDRANGPRRDQPESLYALFRENAQNGWGDMSRIWDDAEAEVDILGNNDFADADLDAYDCIWLQDYQSDNFNNAWNDNRERFEDWVDGGGVIYHATGTNNWNVVPEHVGGLRRDQRGDGNGTVAVTNDPNEDNYCYLAELMGWEGGENLPGGSWSHASYSAQNLDNVENSDWWQDIAHGSGNAGQIGVAVYNFGRGWSIVSGTTDTHQFNNYIMMEPGVEPSSR
jgi:hypothetical protein